MAVPHEVVKGEFAGLHPLRAWREYRGYSQAQLAAMTGISRSYLAQIETGGRAGRVDAIVKLAKSLGCLVADLVSERT